MQQSNTITKKSDHICKLKGMTAQRKGESKSSCPYVFGEDRKAWLFGWEHADIQDFVKKQDKRIGETMPEFSGYIYDGYTRKGYVNKKEFSHPALRFEYRPLLMRDKATVNSQIQRLYAQNKDAEGERLAADAIARRLVNWDLTAQGEIIPTALENVLRVEPVLLARVFSIVMGVSQSDPDPEWSEDETDAHVAASLEAALAGKSLEAVAEESAAKNSEMV